MQQGVAGKSNWYYLSNAAGSDRVAIFVTAYGQIVSLNFLDLTTMHSDFFKP